MIASWHDGLRRIAFISAILLAQWGVCGAAAAAQTYHVDSEAGDDANPGTSPALAWATLKRVNNANLQPGDSMRFKRGGVWRGTLVPASGQEGKPVTYTAYGEGEKPLLLGSASRNKPGDWIETGKHVWSSRKPAWIPKQVILDLRQSHWRFHQEAGAKISMDARDWKSARTHVIECRTSGERANHIQLWGPAVDLDQAVDTGFMLLRFRARCNKPFRTGSFSVMRSVSPWRTLAAGQAPGAAVDTEWTDHSMILQVLASGDQAHLHLNLGASLPTGAIFEFEPLDLVAAECTQQQRLVVDVGNIIFNHGRHCGHKRWKLEDVRQAFDYFHDPKTMQVVLFSEQNPAETHDSIELALRRHIVDQGGRHDIVYDGLDLRYGAAHGFGGGNTARLVIRNCDLSYIGGGHQHTRDDGTPVRYGNAIEFWGACLDHLVENCRISQVYDAALTNQGNGANSIQENITYRNNLIRNCEYSFEYWNNPATARTRNIRFVNNTCVDAGVVWSHAQRPDPNGSHLMFYTNRADTEGVTIRYNVFHNSTDWGSRYSAGWDPLPDMDYNVWHLPRGELCYFFRQHIPADDVKGYRQKTGLDRHSFFGDPGLVDPENGDYRLSPASPASKLHPDGGSIGASL